jgi:hypothetical protein
MRHGFEVTEQAGKEHCSIVLSFHSTLTSGKMIYTIAASAFNISFNCFRVAFQQNFFSPIQAFPVINPPSSLTSVLDLS